MKRLVWGGAGVIALGLVAWFCVWAFRGDDTDPDPGPPVVDPLARPGSLREHPRQREIDQAVARGVAHLKKRLQSEGRLYDEKTRFERDYESVGVAALCGLALLEAGTSADDAAIQAVLHRVRKEAPINQMTYSLGAILFFLNRLHDAQPLAQDDRDLARTLVLRLVAGQQVDGTWSYLNPPLTKKAEDDLVKRLQSNTYKPSGKPFIANTRSMTQFALLALWGSRWHGIAVRPAILAAATSFHTSQRADGSWDYGALTDIMKDSNTCAGLIALAMEKALRDEKSLAAGDPPPNPKVNEQRDRAIVHMAKLIGRTKNDPIGVAHGYHGSVIKADAWGDYYCLWCLERMAVIYGMTHIAGKDWYDWGVNIILPNQNADGSWKDSHGALPDTCFALLFLTRANLAKDLTRMLRHGPTEATLPK